MKKRHIDWTPFYPTAKGNPPKALIEGMRYRVLTFNEATGQVQYEDAISYSPCDYAWGRVDNPIIAYSIDRRPDE